VTVFESAQGAGVHPIVVLSVLSFALKVIVTPISYGTGVEVMIGVMTPHTSGVPAAPPGAVPVIFKTEDSSVAASL
jgi:hypothetical protein